MEETEKKTCDLGNRSLESIKILRLAPSLKGLGVSQPVIQILEQGQPVPMEKFLGYAQNLGKEPRGNADAKW